MNYSEEEISKKIKEERLKHGLSQAELGKKIGVVGKQVSNYERHSPIPPLEVMLKLCDVFDCELGYLLGEKDYSNTTQLYTKISEYTGLDNESINILHHIMTRYQNTPIAKIEDDVYKDILNRIIKSAEFKSCLRALKDLSNDYKDYIHAMDDFENIPNDELKREAIDKDGEIPDDSWIDDKHHKDLINAIALFQQGLDEQRSKEYNLKVDRYELHEIFSKLIDSLFPW